MSGSIYNKPIMFSIVATAVILVGTVVTMFYPMVTPEMHPKLQNLRQYTQLELAGRDIYQREGCNNCHTQTVRPLKTEVMRYGEYSKAGEFAYDQPFLWGSKRTGPDLARIGLRWPNAKIHYDHFKNPQAFVAKSNMPEYGWLESRALKPATTLAHMDALGYSYTEDDKKTLDGKNELDGLVAYMLWLGHAVKPVATDADAGESAAGRMYSDNCAGCHGADGSGGVGPSLIDNIWFEKEGKPELKKVETAILKGTGGGMPPYDGAFTDAEQHELLEYVLAMGAGKAVGMPDGKTIFANNCSGCHGADAKGGFGPNLTDDVWLGHKGPITSEAFEDIVIKGTGGGMPPFGSVLKHDEIEAAVKFVRGLK